jgi:hypothetical protein
MEGQAFDQMNPKPSVTDPHGLGANTVYPKHLHKAGASDDGGPLYVEVRSAQEEADAVADSWLLAKPAGEAEPPATRGPAPTRKRG